MFQPSATWSSRLHLRPTASTQCQTTKSPARGTRIPALAGSVHVAVLEIRTVGTSVTGRFVRALVARAELRLTSQQRNPSPTCLQDWGALQSTAEHSRAQRIDNKATNFQQVPTKVARHQPVSVLRRRGFDSRRLHQFSFFKGRTGQDQGRSPLSTLPKFVPGLIDKLVE
jgi:hypothetical protein